MQISPPNHLSADRRILDSTIEGKAKALGRREVPCTSCRWQIRKTSPRRPILEGSARQIRSLPPRLRRLQKLRPQNSRALLRTQPASWQQSPPPTTLPHPLVPIEPPWQRPLRARAL